jgi:hypothetical protein
MQQQPNDPLGRYDPGPVDMENITHHGFHLSKSDVVDWDRVTGPITDHDWQMILRAHTNKNPGLSGFKMCTLRHLPQGIEKLYRTIVDVMWTRAIMPADQLIDLVALIPKPNGDQRGIVQKEELIKAIDKLLAFRITRSMKPGHKLEELLSAINKAYKRGYSTLDILHPHAIILDHAKQYGNPLTVTQLDLSKHFDTLQMDIVEPILRNKGASQHLIHLIREMQSGADIVFDTPVGRTLKMTRKQGIPQGMALTCALALFQQEPALRALEHAIASPPAEIKTYFAHDSNAPSNANTESIRAVGAAVPSEVWEAANEAEGKVFK